MWRPIIIGRPFLATRRAFINVESGELNFRVNGQKVTFNVCRLMKQPNDLHIISVIDVVDEVLVSVQEVSNVRESLAAVLLNYYRDKIFDYNKVVVAVTGIGSYPKNFIPVEIMCDASGIALGAILAQRKANLFHPIYYASKKVNIAQKNYTITEQEMLTVVYAFEKFCAYLLGTKEFNFEVKERKGCGNQIADHLSRVES
ncbi:uncharacterized protein LOC129892870 [Solanum dulcamara]|uniref:uncharacterized protein LOC129892870 n=1 Tax=Solanum dulcamara TaxID=45834 RepID=UPI0024859514|nr:uncharacterized protein LOC129892870 [Solanum dulcamara]